MLRWTVRVMEKPNLWESTRFIFLEAETFEEAKKLVPLKDNSVATFEVVTNDDDMGNDKRSDKTVDSLHKE